MLCGKDTEHFTRVVGQRVEFPAREDDFVACRFGLLDKVAAIEAAPQPVAAPHSLRQIPFLTRRQDDIGTGRQLLGHDLRAIRTLEHGGEKAGRTGFDRTAGVDHADSNTARLGFFHDAAAPSIGGQRALVGSALRPESRVGHLDTVGVRRGRGVGRGGQSVLLVSAVNCEMGNFVPMDLAVRPGDERPGHLPMGDPRPVDVEENDAAGRPGTMLRLGPSRGDGRGEKKQRHHQGADRPEMTCHSPISSFQSSGSAAMKSSISPMQSASCRTSTSTPCERTYSSGPWKVLFSPTTTLGMP